MARTEAMEKPDQIPTGFISPQMTSLTSPIIRAPRNPSSDNKKKT